MKKPATTSAPSRALTERWFTVLVCLTLLTPLVVFNNLVSFAVPKAYFFRILVELTLPLYAYLVLSSKQYRLSLKNPLTISVFAFFLINLVSALLGDNIWRSIWGNYERMGGVFNLTHLTLFYCYAVSLGKSAKDSANTLLRTVIAVGAAIAVDGVLVKATNNHFLFADPYFPRVSAGLGNPIYLPGFLIIPLFLTVYYLVREHRRWLKAAYLITTLAEFYCVLLSGTRAAVLGIVIAALFSAVVYVCLVSGNRVRLIGSMAAVVVVIALALGITQPQFILTRFFVFRDASSISRLAQWKAALRGFQDRPLLGTGPENYYLVSNKYSLHSDAREIYALSPLIEYTPWYDRPHNYLLELLATTGILGLITYLGMLVTTAAILAGMVHQQILTLTDFCILFAGLVAYVINNLFGFETISASLMFFMFLGWVGLWWRERGPSSEKPAVAPSRGATMVLAGCICVVVTCVIYGADILGFRLAWDMGHGYLYSLSDPRRALAYFEAGRRLPVNYDPVKFSATFSDFAMDAVNNPQVDRSLAKQILQQATEVQQQAIGRVSNDPTQYQYLANLYIAKAAVDKASLDPAAEDSIHRALTLAPGNLLLLKDQARIRLLAGDAHGAAEILERLVRDVPGDLAAQMQLAEAYWYGGKQDVGFQLARNVFDKGYAPRKARDIDWLGPTYEKRGDDAGAIAIYQLAVTLDPNNVDDYWRLAQVYGRTGRKKEAIAIARVLKNVDPSRSKEMDDFISSLH